MNITKVSYSRKFSLPNYENLDLSIEAQLNEKDNPLEVWSILADNTEMWFIDHQRKKETPKPAQTPTTQPVGTPLKNETPQTPAISTTLKWEPMPPSPKGPWEKSEDLDKEIYDKICETGKAVYKNGYLYWILKKDGKVDGLGRRRQ